MRNLNNIDIRHINKKGRYINLNVPLMFDLTDEEIIYLRKLYNNPNIEKTTAPIKFTNKSFIVSLIVTYYIIF